MEQPLLGAGEDMAVLRLHPVDRNTGRQFMCKPGPGARGVDAEDAFIHRGGIKLPVFGCGNGGKQQTVLILLMEERVIGKHPASFLFTWDSFPPC
ncbi:hypothetical protein D3C81_1799190 [compost metagenome]